MKIEELKAIIIDANLEYRNGTPMISDTEYDDYVDTLRKMLSNDEFDEFRKTLTEDSGDVKHEFIMGSLEKIKAFDNSASIKDWIYKHIPNNGDGSDGFFVSSKIDGCSGCLVYENGKLVSASTRGDGSVGKDILRKAKLFVNDNIGNFTGTIRGEVTLTKETFAALIEFTGKEYKNLRNTTSGLINKKNAPDEEVSFLRFFAYEIMGESGLTKSEQFKKLKSLGFNTALYKECTDIYNNEFLENHSYDDALLSIFNQFTQDAPFDIDGLVISDLNDQDVFENEFIPERTVAVKFNQLTAESKLIDIQWDVSKSGRLSPVGIIEPVQLGGSTVSAVTLNNLDYMKEIGVKYGCQLTILKSGDIIPKIVSVQHKSPETETDITFPSKCPKCGCELEYKDGEIFPMCTNHDCSGMLLKKIVYMLEKLGIKHVKERILEDIGVFHVKDLLELKPVGGKLQKNLVKDLEKKLFGVDKETLLMCFDYNGVSSAIITKMLDFYGYDKLIASTADELKVSMPYGIGEKFIDKFVNGFTAIKDDYNMIINDSRYVGHMACRVKENITTDGPLHGAMFVVTGELVSMKRKEFEKVVRSNGGIFQTSVSKSTSYLVTNDTKMTTKMRKAVELGVKIINEQQFLNMIPMEEKVSIF